MILDHFCKSRRLKSEHSDLLQHNNGIKLPKGSADCVLLMWSYRDGCHESGLQDAGVAFTSFLDL